MQKFAKKWAILQTHGKVYFNFKKNVKKNKKKWKKFEKTVDN